MAVIRYASELTDREFAIGSMHRNKQFWYLKKEEEMTDAEAHKEMDRIDRKIDEIDSFELRQKIRHAKINLARVEASVKGTNELLIMSEV